MADAKNKLFLNCNFFFSGWNKGLVLTAMRKELSLSLSRTSQSFQIQPKEQVLHE